MTFIASFVKVKILWIYSKSICEMILNLHKMTHKSCQSQHSIAVSNFTEY